MTENSSDTEFSEEEREQIGDFETLYSKDEFAGKFWTEFKDFVTGLPKASILVMGGSGAGKSTLVNLVFNSEVARSGEGRPVTQGIDEYQNDLVHIYDSQGYEFGAENQREYEKLIMEFLDRHEREGNPVDVCWYCISAPGARVVETDINMISRLNSLGKPVAAVLTQVDQATEDQCAGLKSEILSRTTLRSDAMFESTTDFGIALPRGTDELYEWTRDRLPESRRASFMGAARRDMDRKSADVDSFLLKYAATAFGIGAAPIPVPSAAALIPLQMKMLSEIAVRWNVLSMEQTMGTLLTQMVTTTVGRTVAASLLKLIPGAGQLVGGIINGSVAGAVTYGVGKAFNYGCYQLQKSQLDGSNFNFDDFLKNEFVQMALKMAMSFKDKKK